MYFQTSMHSSRMRTARLLPISPSMHCEGGVCLLLGGSGCLLQVGGGDVSQHALRKTPLPVNRMTDRQV